MSVLPEILEPISGCIKLDEPKPLPSTEVIADITITCRARAVSFRKQHAGISVASPEKIYLNRCRNDSRLISRIGK